MQAIALASNDRATLNAWQQSISSLQNVRLSGRQGKGVGLPMASTVASFLVPKPLGYAQWPDRLVFRPCAVLMRRPRANAESIIAYSTHCPHPEPWPGTRAAAHSNEPDRLQRGWCR